MVTPVSYRPGCGADLQLELHRTDRTAVCRSHPRPRDSNLYPHTENTHDTAVNTAIAKRTKLPLHSLRTKRSAYMWPALPYNISLSIEKSYAT